MGQFQVASISWLSHPSPGHELGVRCLGRLGGVLGLLCAERLLPVLVLLLVLLDGDYGEFGGRGSRQIVPGKTLTLHLVQWHLRTCRRLPPGAIANFRRRFFAFLVETACCSVAPLFSEEAAGVRR